MENIIAKFPGKSGSAIAITGHFDTKKMANFVGANDGASSTGILLEMAAVLAGRPRTDDVYIVFFDGEEAVRDWTDTDSVYGSRHLARKWTDDGTNGRMKALINVDMTGVAVSATIDLPAYNRCKRQLAPYDRQDQDADDAAVKWATTN